MSDEPLPIAEGVIRVTGPWLCFYLVERGDGAVTLVDAGFPGQRAELEALLDGRAVRDVVVTHAHADHIGLCEWARRTFGATVWVPEGDAKLARRPLLIPAEKLPLPYVFRERATRRLYAGAVRLGAWRQVRGLRTFSTYAPGATVAGLRAVATSGHTSGHCSLLLEDRSVLFAGDAVVTEDPYTGRTGPRLTARCATWNSEVARASLDAIASTGASIVLSGHGEPWTGGAAAAADTARAAPQA